MVNLLFQDFKHYQHKVNCNKGKAVLFNGHETYLWTQKKLLSETPMSAKDGVLIPNSTYNQENNVCQDHVNFRFIYFNFKCLLKTNCNEEKY